MCGRYRLSRRKQLIAEYFRPTTRSIGSLATEAVTKLSVFERLKKLRV